MSKTNHTPNLICHCSCGCRRSDVRLQIQMVSNNGKLNVNDKDSQTWFRHLCGFGSVYHDSMCIIDNDDSMFQGRVWSVMQSLLVKQAIIIIFSIHHYIFSSRNICLFFKMGIELKVKKIHKIWKIRKLPLHVQTLTIFVKSTSQW